VPMYEYKCAKCGNRFEKIEPVSAPTTQKCPKCCGKAERQLAAPAIQFKGSGWYVTDYGGKGATSPAKSDGAEAKSGDSTTESSTKPSTSKEASGKPKKK
jgi:putative FmdB family regulatory protein